MSSGKKGRPKTRELTRWDNDKDIRILLSIVKLCNQEGIKIPWDLVAKEIGENVSGNALIQHLSKLRKKVEENIRKGVKTTPQKSGYIAGGGGSKQKPAVKTAKARTKGNGDDRDDGFDVDKASDPDESYGETLAKRKQPKRARSAQKSYKDEPDDEDGDEADPVTPQGGIKAENEGTSVKDESASLPSKRRKLESSPTLPETPTKPRQRRGNVKHEAESDIDNDGKSNVKMKRTHGSDVAVHSESNEAEQVAESPKAAETTDNVARSIHNRFGANSGNRTGTANIATFDPFASVPLRRPGASASRRGSVQQPGLANNQNVHGSPYPAMANYQNRPVPPTFGAGPRYQQAVGSNAGGGTFQQFSDLMNGNARSHPGQSFTNWSNGGSIGPSGFGGDNQGPTNQFPSLPFGGNNDDGQVFDDDDVRNWVMHS